MLVKLIQLGILFCLGSAAEADLSPDLILLESVPCAAGEALAAGIGEHTPPQLCPPLPMSFSRKIVPQMT